LRVRGYPDPVADAIAGTDAMHVGGRARSATFRRLACSDVAATRNSRPLAPERV
jgi:hypothetical protein